MPDDTSWMPLLRVARIIGALMALGALGLIGRFAILLTEAWHGHPTLHG
jgi:hypothetical protein